MARSPPPVPAEPSDARARSAHTGRAEDMTVAIALGLPTHVGFPEIAVFGLTPVAARGLIGLVVDALRGGTEIPLGVELVGLLDNELRAVFAPVDGAVGPGVALVREGSYCAWCWAAECSSVCAAA